MVEEEGRIIAVAEDHLWLQTTQKSSCDSCRGRNVCGQRLLQNLNESHGLLKVPLDGRAQRDFKLQDRVSIGIEESTLVRASAIAYLIPLLMLIVLAYVGQQLGGEGLSILGAVLGLLLGSLWGRYRLAAADCQSRYQPRLLQ
ncbi:SoxR reducing system RseC family protein [uncultured Pseudoteredinibacter sp.]|uniref:SoxR reducing system RseC family protein n=1 Tax=uncultured Pseudoteredinibacter sp. TaxID=1641701 RepID=UPI00261C3708|nr:SoxR reducing system RseC family protein [uncultured Pseudoteredinibacter sp.]